MAALKSYSDEIIGEVSEILSRENKPLNSENILCLGQTEGSKGVMFVLYRFNHVDYSYSTGRDPMQFQCILAGDLVEAANKARRVCGDRHISLDIEHNFERTKLVVQKRFFAEKYPELMEMLETKNYIIQDIKRYFERKGNLSQAQIDLVGKIYESQLVYDEKVRVQKEEQLKYAELEKFYFNEGERVEVEISKEIARFSFDTDFGLMTVIKWITKCDKLVIYSGCSPKDIEAGMKIKATIKHKMFKSVEQTLLQRITIIK